MKTRPSNQPSAKTRTKNSNNQDSPCMASVKITQGSQQNKHRDGILIKVIQIAMDKRTEQHAFQTIKGSWVNPVFRKSNGEFNFQPKNEPHQQNRVKR